MKSFDIKHTLNFSCLFTICNFAPTKAKSRSNKRSNVRQGKTVVLTSSSNKAFLEESKQAKTRKVQVNKDRSAQIKVPRQTKDNKGNKRTTKSGGGGGGGAMVCLCPPRLIPHFFFPLELYVYITLTNNYLAFFIYQLIILWTISIN